MANLYRTQKARGVEALCNSAYTEFDRVPPFRVLHSAQAVREMTEHDRLTLRFARPCPTTPRHGFVESRIIESPEELQAIWEETRAADPNGELIMMAEVKELPAQPRLSLVLTPTFAVVGDGTDGATNGAPGCVTLPIGGVHIPEHIRAMAGITDTPFVEAVYGACLWSTRPMAWQVQLRDGHAPSGDANADSWVPQDTVVERILYPEGFDLLQWADLVATASPGTVIHHAGGNMLSHWTQHAIQHRVPIVFGPSAPEQGAVLRANVNVTARTYPAQFQDGLLLGATGPVDRSAVRGAIWVAHNATALRQSPTGAKVAGIGYSILLRAATAAILGELRHCRYARTGNVSRDEIYETVLAGFDSLWKTRRRLRDSVKTFENDRNWRGDSFGGPAWASCARTTFRLYKTIADAIRAEEPEAQEAAFWEVNNTAHVLINEAHNGGPLLNKFTSSSTFDYAAEGQLGFVVNALFQSVLSLRDRAGTDPALLAHIAGHWRRERLSRRGQ